MTRTEPGADGGLASRLGHRFADPSLLERALTHRSWCAEHPGEDSNERLEFLGDAVLGLVVASYLFQTWPDRAEGDLAKMRAAVVSAATLADTATALHLGEEVRLGKGEHASGGGAKPSILADTLEAVFGAVFLDGGMEAARTVVLGALADRLDDAASGPGTEDHKTQLQEVAARLFEELPVYDVHDEGPDHDKRFFATVHLAGVARGTGEGRSKKQAEQAAAGQALESLIAGVADGDRRRHFVRVGPAGDDAAGSGDERA